MAKGFDAVTYLNDNWAKVRERLHDPSDAPFLWSKGIPTDIIKRMYEDLHLPEELEKHYVHEPMRMLMPYSVDYSLSCYATIFSRFEEIAIIGGIGAPQETPTNPERSLITAAYHVGILDCNPFYSMPCYMTEEPSINFHNYNSVIVDILTAEHFGKPIESSRGIAISKLIESYPPHSRPLELFKQTMKVIDVPDEKADEWVLLAGQLSSQIKRNIRFLRKSADGKWERFNF